MNTISKIRFLFFSLFSLMASTVFAQNEDTLTMQKEKNRLRADTINLNLKNIATQLVTLRDSLGVEIMSMDKKMSTLHPRNKKAIEKSKNKLTIYKSELEKLIEEVTVADISLITEVKKRAYHTVLDVRADFYKILAESKVVN